MKNLIMTLCISSFFIAVSNVDCCLEYKSDGIYKYNDAISQKSETVNSSLKEDVTALIVKLKSENRTMTSQDKRECANEFFIKHSVPVAISAEIKDFKIKSEKDQYEIPVRLYTPMQRTKKLVVFIHGGGWMQGNLETHDYLCKTMVKTLGCKVLAIDYRLAPEYKFPVGLEDVESVYKWCVGPDSKNLLGDISEMYLSGDSAGGNLSAAINIKLHKIGFEGHFPDGLILFYPPLSHESQTASFKIFKDQVALSAVGAVNFMEQYIGNKIDAPEVINNALIFPINAESNMFPRTIMIAAGCDVLLDGQIALFNKLKGENVSKNEKVKLLIVNRAVHGFMTFGKEFDEEVNNALHKVKDWMEKKRD